MKYEQEKKCSTQTSQLIQNYKRVDGSLVLFIACKIVLSKGTFHVHLCNYQNCAIGDIRRLCYLRPERCVVYSVAIHRMLGTETHAIKH